MIAPEVNYSNGGGGGETLSPPKSNHEPLISDMIPVSVPPGVVLVQSLQLSGFLQYGVRQAAETENYFTSVERIQAYTDLPSEAQSDTPEGLLSPHWPAEGRIQVEGLTMTYRADLDPVFVGLTFEVGGGEGVGGLGEMGLYGNVRV